MCCTSCGEAHVKRTYNGSYTRTLCLFHSLTHSLNHALLLLSPHCLFDSLLSSRIFPSSVLISLYFSLLPLLTYHSSHTTHHTLLILHHSSHSTRHTPLITHHSSYTTHHTPLILHHSSHTTHHTLLILHHSSHTTHHTSLILHHSSHTTHHTSLISFNFIVQDFSALFSSQSLLPVASSDKLSMWSYPVLLLPFSSP